MTCLRSQSWKVAEPGFRSSSIQAIRPVLLVTLTPSESVVPKLQVNWDGLLEVQALGERVFAKRLL